MELHQFKGKFVQIYPGDTKNKFGKITDITANGVVFLITKSEDEKQYPVGKHVFIAFSARLSFLEV